MTNFKKIFLLFFLILLTNCGYSPLLSTINDDFNINNLSFGGDRQINNYISSNLKKYQNKKAKKNYKIDIDSKYEKSVVNKDDSGNPKNYTIKTEVLVTLFLNDETIKTQTFERSASYSAQDKRINEKELENKYKKDLSNLLGQDIIFLLRNQ
tara:strand:- start:364 stop:822 length:459 start_codon:yes stop_codon:yes gene_type:complete